MLNFFLHFFELFVWDLKYFLMGCVCSDNYKPASEVNIEGSYITLKFSENEEPKIESPKTPPSKILVQKNNSVL